MLRQFQNITKSLCSVPVVRASERVLHMNPNKPLKKPMSAFVAYMKERYPKLREEHPSLSLVRISKICSDEWLAKDPSYKQSMASAYQTQLEEYRVEMKKYQEGLSPEQRRKIQLEEAEAKVSDLRAKVKRLEKTLERPVMSRSAYSEYVAGNPDMFDAMNRWKALSLEDKEKKLAEWRERKKIHEETLSKWFANLDKESGKKLEALRTRYSKAKTELVELRRDPEGFADMVPKRSAKKVSVQKAKSDGKLGKSDGKTKKTAPKKAVKAKKLKKN